MKDIRKIMLLGLAVAFTTMASARKETYQITVKRPVSKAQTNFTKVPINTTWLAYGCGVYRLQDESFSVAQGSSDWQPVAEIWGTDSVMTTCTNSTSGHWFDANGRPVNSSKRYVGIRYASGNLCFSHRSTGDVVQAGDKYDFAELLIHDTDTIRLVCHMDILESDAAESYTDNLPTQSYYHRADVTDSWLTMPVIRVNDGEPVTQNWIQVKPGDKITLNGKLMNEKYDSLRVRWDDAAGTMLRTYGTDDFVLTESATAETAGSYTMRARQYYINSRGNHVNLTSTYTLFIDVVEDNSSFLDWTGKVPEFSYNFKDEYGEISAPQNILGEVGETDRYGKKVNRVSGDWWTVCWGSNLNTECGTDSATVYQAAKNLIDKYETDFAYIRDEMGWPPDIRARKGYKSTVYIFGSGLKCDNTVNTEKGGYQSAIWYSDPKTGIAMNWPCVWASYYPFSRFRSDADKKFTDGDYQREAMIHEGIHALFADMDGCKNSSWFHEAGNTWLQSAMAVRRSGTYGTPGFLDGCPFLAPFMPIECYSGWLQDGSFGGPQAEGVNMYNASGQQVCTWRTYLGGNQYGNGFPIILSTMCGDGSIPWIWRNCKTYVLKGIGDYIGDEGMRTLIMQYRARQACFDFGGWSNGYRKITSDYFGQELGPEWEPYNIDCGKWKATCYQQVRPNDAEGWYAPDMTTCPGWSGSNIIPMIVDPSAGAIKLQFRPENSEERCILCYKTKSGESYYSQVIKCGDVSIPVDDSEHLPANNIVFCVVANTDYIYTGDTQRKTHYDYRVRPVQGIKGFASKDIRWFFNDQTLSDTKYDPIMEPATGINDVYGSQTSSKAAKGNALADHLRLMTGMIMAGRDVQVECTDINPTDVKVYLAGMQGIVEGQGQLNASGCYRLPSYLQHGLYALVLEYKGQRVTYKIIVK